MAQGNLFDSKMPPKEPNEDYLHRQLIKLGDMMGDGLHNEPDGKWISREYKNILKQIEPDIFKNARRKKAESVNAQIANLVKEKKCTCGGDLKQARSGSKICYCSQCNERYKAVSKKSEKE